MNQIQTTSANKSDASAVTTSNLQKSSVPAFASLHDQLNEANILVEDIVLKKYLSKINSLEVLPLADSLKQVDAIHLFKITEMVYQNDEYSTYKFASVFNSVQHLNCGVFIIADSNGQKTEFYMGVRSFDEKRTTSSFKNTLKNALCGQFPGVKTKNLLNSEAEDFFAKIPLGNIAAVSCVAKNKDEEFKDNQSFIQGLEKLALAMQGKRYTAVVLAKSAPVEQLNATRLAYETIYTQLSPFASTQLSYGRNTALSISDAFSQGATTGTSHSTNNSTQVSESLAKGITTNESVTKSDGLAMLGKAVAILATSAAGIALTPATGGMGTYIAVGAITGAIGSFNPKSTTKGMSASETQTTSQSQTIGESDSSNESRNKNDTHTTGSTDGTSSNMQLTRQNKTLINLLERIDLQLKRIDECESLGMWECAAYFLSDSQETAEMAAGTYKALMKGEKSGLEVSAINFWGAKNKEQLPILREYITNFIHPVFAYHSELTRLSVTASSLVSGNELAIQMGLPRKSLCGFPVIEHADFGKEVVKYDQGESKPDFTLGKIFSMGQENKTEVRLDRDSLTMHTFITGSTGSGKSNAVYEILDRLDKKHKIPFLVIEPAKGEYKNVFGQRANVSVYGTNPKKHHLLRINPFSFPSDIHVLEHLDRLVELFNVCWPMYAAMPAILKEAAERAYASVGWNINTSENSKGNIFPNFSDLLEQIENVINESKYSTDSKGNYSGALCTRVRSLTTGLNGLIFAQNELSAEDIFEKNVIVDLSRVGSTETKSLIMGLLVMKLNEHRMTSGISNSPLRHITVLEEAHNLLRRTSTEQSSDSANLVGKSVELLANSIAEMRTFGEGFIIADQSPGLLDMSVIRNTNTKIILRLPEQSDRELVGFAANLDVEQIKELAKLERGVAAIYQNDWVEPVLVKINKCKIEETPYITVLNPTQVDIQSLKKKVIFFLMQGRVDERLDFDVEDIERNVDALACSVWILDFIKEQIKKFKENGKPSVLSDQNFAQVSRCITELLNVRQKVENHVVSSANDRVLSNSLSIMVKQSMPDASEEITLAISQCVMKDLSLQQEESESRERIYKQWFEFINKGGVEL